MFNPEDLAKLQDKDLWAAFDSADEDLEKLEIYSVLKDRLWEKEDYNTIIGLSDRMCEIAEKSEEFELVGVHRYTQGSAHFNIDSFAEAAHAYGLAAKAAAELGDQGKIAKSLWAKADSYFSLDQFSEALETALESANLAKADGQESLAGKSMFLYAKSLYRLDRDEEAITALEETRDHFRNAGESDKVAEVDDYRARVLEYLDRNSEANEYLRACLLIWESRKNNQWIAYTCRRLGWNLKKLNLYTEAIEYFEAAKKKYLEIDDISEIPECEFGLGDSYQDMDEHEKAIQYFSQARALADANGNDNITIRADMLRAVSLHNLERYMDARNLNFRILQYLEAKQDNDFNDEIFLARTRAADNALQMENWADALEILSEGNLKQEFVPRTQILIWRMSIRARALYSLGREDEAFAEVDSALKLTTDEFENWVTAYLYEIRGQVLLHKNKREGSRDLAHSIALHLANNQDEQARKLSIHFMPSHEETFSLDSTSSDVDRSEILGKSPTHLSSSRENS